MKKLNKIIILVATVALFFVLLGGDTAFAQCPMCKAAAEANLKEGGTAGAGLNDGILYLFFTPYLIALTLGVTWWWYNKKNKEELVEG
ncbi:MAG: hypothetical protein ACPGXL_02590 [Chitinophagales bacterium]